MPAFEGEAGTEAYRRDLLNLMAALADWDKSGGTIDWQPQLRS